MRLDNKGSTMVEITVGFLLLIILFASFIKIIELSSQMTDYSIDVKNKNIEYQKMYYGIETNGIVDNSFRTTDDIYLTTSNGQTSLSETSDGAQLLAVTICELDKDKLNAWVNDSTNNAWTNVEKNETLTLKNIKIKRLENINNEDAAKIQIFKYVFTPPAATPTTP